jgi:DNA-binding FrmR family transcriptional regulator
MKDDKKIIQRLNRIIGQLEGVKKMISKENTKTNTCTDILTQFKASNSALENTMKLFSISQINYCFHSLEKKDSQEELNKILDSIIK